MGLFFSRVFGGFYYFLSSFVPRGTPLWIAPFVCLAETLRYFVRPFVLMIRPFVKLRMGARGGYILGVLGFQYSGAFILLGLLFFYEVFVAVVH